MIMLYLCTFLFFERIIYFRIAKALKKSERHRASIQSRRPNLESNRKTVIKMQGI